MNNCIFKDGDQVEISQDLSKTEKFYGVEESMRMMRGKIYTINKVVNQNEIIIGKYIWHPTDLIPVFKGSPPEIKIEIFDPKNLVT